jgi:hypothetical protein
MKGRSAFALCTLGLCFAAPAKSQNSGAVAGGPNPALSGMTRLHPGPQAPLPQRSGQVQFSADSAITHDGTPGDRRSIVGSLPLLGPVAAEVGLFSVTGANQRERELKRSDPMADVQPRRSRVAAVGLRMDF